MEGPYQYAAAHEREDTAFLLTTQGKGKVADITSAKCLIRSEKVSCRIWQPLGLAYTPLQVYDLHFGFSFLPLLSLPELAVLSAHAAGRDLRKEQQHAELEATCRLSCELLPQRDVRRRGDASGDTHALRLPDRTSFACELEREIFGISICTPKSLLCLFTFGLHFCSSISTSGARHVAKTCVALEEYTVCVKHLPPKVTEKISRRFSNLSILSESPRWCFAAAMTPSGYRPTRKRRSFLAICGRS